VTSADLNPRWFFPYAHISKLIMNSRFVRFIVVASLILNIALLTKVMRRKGVVMEPVAAPQVTRSAPVEAQAASFRWSQLEAGDYATYIANLRGIGCPERTVREIVAADVDDLYAPRREPLLTKIAAGGASPDLNLAQNALAQLRSEQDALIRKLFGISEPAPTTSAIATQTASSPSSERGIPSENADRNSSLPLAYQSLDPSRMQLTAEQLQSISEVKQSFVAALGTDLDMNSPEYLKRWQTAQKQADSLMGALIGRQAELNYEDAVQSQ